jgi:hypothetical protein
VLLVVIGATGVWRSSSRGSGILILLIGLVLAFRSARSSAVVVDDSGVRARSLFRTYHFGFSDLRDVEVRVGRTGLAGFNREHLAFKLANGNVIAFKELNCPPPKAASAQSVVRRAAARIREDLLET